MVFLRRGCVGRDRAVRARGQGRVARRGHVGARGRARAGDDLVGDRAEQPGPRRACRGAEGIAELDRERPDQRDARDGVVLIADVIAGVPRAERAHRRDELLEALEVVDEHAERGDKLLPELTHVAVEEPAQRPIEFEESPEIRGGERLGRGGGESEGIAHEADLLVVQQRHDRIMPEFAGSAYGPVGRKSAQGKGVGSGAVSRAGPGERDLRRR